jgi:hypothetical protein
MVQPGNCRSGFPELPLEDRYYVESFWHAGQCSARPPHAGRDSEIDPPEVERLARIAVSEGQCVCGMLRQLCFFSLEAK